MVAIFPKCACPILWAPSSKPSFQILVLTLNCYVFQEPCNLKIGNYKLCFPMVLSQIGCHKLNNCIDRF